MPQCCLRGIKATPHGDNCTLPEALKLEAESYARGLGVSLNALLAVALRDYLDARRGLAAIPAKPAALAVSVEAVAASLPHGLADLVRQAPAGAVRVRQPVPDEAPAGSPQVPDWSVVPAEGPKALCPCRSGRRWKNCHAPKGKPLTLSRAMS